MRQCNSNSCAEAMYLHGDHLGSVSLITDDNGNVVSQARYTPYGEVRWPTVSQMPTDFGYTGQRADSFGLMDYNARFYSPHLGRFVSADSIIPNPAKVVSFDRFVYGDSNPIKYRDPSGHLACDAKYVAEGDCSEITWDLIDKIEIYGVTITGDFTLFELHEVLKALDAVGSALLPYTESSNTAAEAFSTVFGPMTFNFDSTLIG